MCHENKENTETNKWLRNNMKSKTCLNAPILYCFYTYYEYIRSMFIDKH